MLRRLFGGDEAPDNLRIVITRHGERADLALGDNWLRKVRRHGDHDSQISRLPRRPNFREWKFDPPLTIAGEKQSASLGRKLLELGYPIDYCYSSPAYRSIQTANRILESQGRKAVPSNIEPGLFECPSWYNDAPLVFIPPEYLAMDRRFKINTGYAPIYDSVDPSENEKQFYQRSRHLIDAIVQTHRYEGGTVLLSAHGGSIEALTRGMRGVFSRRGNPENLEHEALRVDYCNFAILERDKRTGAWTARFPESYNSPYSVIGLGRRNVIPLHSVTTHQRTSHRAGRSPHRRTSHRAGRSPHRRTSSRITHNRYNSHNQHPSHNRHSSQYRLSSHNRHRSHYR
ncbi:unnamed protein product [Rotaria sp. Silwood2]|nr:unnamed protein product [Rotaria sp. Silwood2]CAF4095321.1 unnamed protein product [Rotaria sp. Silwood2]